MFFCLHLCVSFVHVSLRAEKCCTTSGLPSSFMPSFSPSLVVTVLLIILVCAESITCG